jgi:drug/metabolite transporter (DMT)-like permease
MPASIRWFKCAPALFLLLWSCGFVFVKMGLAYADPLTFLAIRYACVLGILIIPFLIVRPALPATRSAWLHLGVVGLLLQAGYFCFIYLSLKYGMSASGLALLTSQQPLLIGLLAPWLVNEAVGWMRLAGICVGVVGAGMVILAKSSVQIGSSAGLLLGAAALLSITAGTLWQKRFGTDTHPITANLVQYGIGLAVSAPLAIWLEPMHVEWTGTLIGSLIYLVVGNSIVAMSLLLTMIRIGEASRVSALFFLVPPATAVVAWIVLHEAIAPLAWAGMLLAAAGIYLVTRKPAVRAPLA